MGVVTKKGLVLSGGLKMDVRAKEALRGTHVEERFRRGIVSRGSDIVRDLFSCFVQLEQLPRSRVIIAATRCAVCSQSQISSLTLKFSSTAGIAGFRQRHGHVVRLVPFDFSKKLWSSLARPAKASIHRINLCSSLLTYPHLYVGSWTPIPSFMIPR